MILKIKTIKVKKLRSYDLINFIYIYLFLKIILNDYNLTFYFIKNYFFYYFFENSFSLFLYSILDIIV